MRVRDARSMALVIAAAEIIDAVDSQLECLDGREKYTVAERDMIMREAASLAKSLRARAMRLGNGPAEYLYRFCAEPRPAAPAPTTEESDG